MAKKLICFLLVLLTLPLTLALGRATDGLPRVVDEADLLTYDQEQALNQAIASLAETYGVDVVILTVNDLGGKTAEAYADDYYDDHGYGFGDDYSGVLLLISMSQRDWWISTSGDCIYAISDYGVQELFSEMSWDLSENRFYEAFDVYLEALHEYFEAWQSGDPIDGWAGDYDGPGSYQPGTREDVVYYSDDQTFQNLLISVGIGLVAALIALLIMRGQMNSRRSQAGAADYLVDGSYDLRVQTDRFLYSNVTKTARPKDNGGSSGRGGGSSVHRSSGGRSHGGGGGKF